MKSVREPLIYLIRICIIHGYRTHKYVLDDASMKRACNDRRQSGLGVSELCGTEGVCIYGADVRKQCNTESNSNSENRKCT